ncbi:hypothetical protein [Nonomuraea sp. NPDC049607]
MRGRLPTYPLRTAPGAATTGFGFQATRPDGDTALPSGYTCA